MKAYVTSFLFHSIIFLILCIPCHPSNGFLWKVTGNGITAPSYILGTESTTSIDVAQEASGFQTSWNNTSQVMTTCSMPLQETSDEDRIVEILNKLGKQKDSGKIFMDSTTSYEKLYTPQQIAFIDSMTTKYMPPLSKIRVMSLYLWNFFLQKENIMDVHTSEKEKTLSDVYHEIMNWMEVALERNAKQEGKSYMSLESLQDELNAIAEADSLERSYFTVEEQALIFYQQMRYKSLYPSSCTFDKRLKALYQTNDYKLLDSLYANDDYRLDSLELPIALKRKLHRMRDMKREIVTETRTMKWLPSILAAIRQKPTFIAVDLTHLLGQKSLINLLRTRGFIVKRVCIK